MAKTIKVIDLLNKIANGEDVPEKIEYQEEIYEWDNKLKKYATETGYTLEIYTKKIDLIEPVEIIKEQQDIDIQDIKEIDEYFSLKYINSGLKKETEEDLDAVINGIYSKINKILQAVKQLDKNIKDKE